MLCLEPNAGILPLAIEFMLRKSQKLSLSLEIILLNKTSKYRELVFATELISIFRFSRLKYVVPVLSYMQQKIAGWIQTDAHTLQNNRLGIMSQSVNMWWENTKEPRIEPCGTPKHLNLT